MRRDVRLVGLGLAIVVCEKNKSADRVSGASGGNCTTIGPRQEYPRKDPVRRQKTLDLMPDVPTFVAVTFTGLPPVPSSMEFTCMKASNTSSFTSGDGKAVIWS